MFYSKFGLTLNLLFLLALVCGLIVASFIDFEYQLIPDSVSLGGIALGLAINAVKGVVGAHSVRPLQDSLAGALIGGGSIYAIGFIGKILFRKKLEAIKEDSAMGLGDVKLLAMIGAFLGWRKVLLVFFLAPIFGSVAGLALKIRYKAEIIPYGPYLSLAAVIAVLWGDEIIRRLICYVT